MKTICEVLNKKYDKALKDHKGYKKQLSDMVAVLKENNIPCGTMEDADCFRYELIYRSILVKQKFENTFFDTYVHMFDYWYDLTYLERKQQMNVDIDALRSTLVSFSFEGETIYMPCFDARINHLYHTEIVLLDLKQYHAYIRTFQAEVHDGLYGSLPYEHGFSSAQLIASMGTNYVLYHPLSNRLYVYDHNQYQSCCSLSEKDENVDQKELKELAMLLLLQRDEDIAESLINGTLVNDKMKKSISKWLKKFQKKNKSD